MKLRSSRSTDWWSDIDISKDGWCQRIFFQCPGLSSKFPPELLATITERSRHWGYQRETPDGKSFKHWTKYPRLSVLKEGEENHYQRFDEWFSSIRWDGFQKELNWGGLERCAMLAVDWCLWVRRLFSDEEMLRYLEEFWTRFTYDKMKELINVDIWWAKKLKDHLATLLERLQAHRDDEMGDLVWSDENRKEDADNNERLRNRRAPMQSVAQP